MIMSKSKTDKVFMQCLPLVTIDMNRGEINIWDFGIPNKIRPNLGCPISRVDSRTFRVMRTIETFKPNSHQMVLVNQFDKSWHFFYPLLQFYGNWVKCILRYLNKMWTITALISPYLSYEFTLKTKAILIELKGFNIVLIFIYIFFNMESKIIVRNNC